MTTPQTHPDNEIHVVSVHLVRERTESPTASGPQQADEIFRRVIGDQDRECAWLACLDARNRINALSMISMGTLTSSLMHPREIYNGCSLSILT